MTRRSSGKGKTRAEHNAYSRGYNAGRNRAWRSYLKVIEYAKSWREKARVGFGAARCDACELWERGGEKCRWGHCNQRRKFDCSPELGSAWAEAEDYKGAAYLITHENFACINFKRRSQ